ncbi:MAG: hypothetical protein ABIL09_17520, partial [Gemmatimonadota bacterium]
MSDIALEEDGSGGRRALAGGDGRGLRGRVAGGLASVQAAMDEAQSLQGELVQVAHTVDHIQRRVPKGRGRAGLGRGPGTAA